LEVLYGQRQKTPVSPAVKQRQAREHKAHALRLRKTLLQALGLQALRLNKEREDIKAISLAMHQGEKIKDSADGQHFILIEAALARFREIHPDNLLIKELQEKSSIKEFNNDLGLS
jgi:hypothetical protein